MTSATAPVRSFLKWVGGKTRTADTLAALAPPDGFGTYFEPFAGSSAVYFALRPSSAVLSDANEELVICLQEVAAEPKVIMGLLDEMSNTRRAFNEIRDWDTSDMDPAIRAARVIYLNKTAFRGLWRVNRQGRFNTPWGAYDRPYYNRDTLLAASAALRGATILHEDFRTVLSKPGDGDWVYLDPPYVPDRKWGDFNRYTPGKFDVGDQRDLSELCAELDDRGVRWLLTNSDTDLVRELYKEWHLAVLPTRRDITLAAKDRKSRDLVVSNYSLPRHEAIFVET